MKASSKKTTYLVSLIISVAALLTLAVFLFLTLRRASNKQEHEKTPSAPNYTTSDHDNSDDTPTPTDKIEKTEEEEETKEEETNTPFDSANQIADRLSSMSLEEKVAQLFFITPEALTGFQTVTAAGETTKAALDRYPVGGLVYFSQNLLSPTQTKEMLSTIQDYMTEKQGFPIFLGVDEEGG